MKRFMLLVFFVIGVSSSQGVNIRVANRFGLNSYVEAEEVLEAALTQALYGVSGIWDVDVDDSWRRPAVFEVEISSSSGLPADFKNELKKILINKLGLPDVRVEHGPRGNVRWPIFFGMFGVREWFYVHFNPDTMVKHLEPLAQKMASITNLSLEDSPWD